MKIQISLILIGFACSALAAPATVEPQILKNLQQSSTTNVLVTFKKANPEAAIARFKSLALATRNAKLNAQYNILKDHADTVQAGVMSMLEKTRASKKHDLRQLWITTELIVRDADKETVEQLRNHPDVESLVAEKFFPLEPVEIRQLAPFEIVPLAQWGVEDIRADKVWQTGNLGQDAVVATIDTGVRYTHVALNSNFRGTLQGGDNNYAWYAPTGKAANPSDTNGHGTHTMGTIAGNANGIGVAPGVTWIACRGCSTTSCSTFDLSECGHWVACPTTTSGTNPDCTKAPNAASNSWGGGQADTWYDAIIEAWRRVHISPIFAAGNSGPNCQTVNSPSDNAGTISVASYTSDHTISSFSSVGPTRDGRMKPDVAAPGSSVVSASSTSDTGYVTMSGTSMATPHAAGVAALAYTAKPGLTADQFKAALIAGAQHITASGKTCSGVSDGEYPNHHCGAGRIDAVETLVHLRNI